MINTRAPDGANNRVFQKMRGQEVILLNFPISHFLKSLAHSSVCIAQESCYVLHVDRKKWSGEKIIASWKTIRAGRNIFSPIKFNVAQ